MRESCAEFVGSSARHEDHSTGDIGMLVREKGVHVAARRARHREVADDDIEFPVAAEPCDGLRSVHARTTS